MTMDEVLSFFGHKQSNVVRAIGISRNSVSRWYTSNSIPFDKQCLLEVLTQGKLKARILDDKYENARRQCQQIVPSDK